MIEKKVRKRPLNDKSATADDLAYRMSKTPEERVAAVEYLRNLFYGNEGRPRFQRVARFVKRSSR